MKTLLIYWLIILFAFIGVIYLAPKLPPIYLPKGAQHNTIGELPLVEVMDDGDFYEMDGDEYIYEQRMKNCLYAQGACKDKKCEEEIKSQCEKYKGRMPCEVQDKILGSIFSCFVGFE